MPPIRGANHAPRRAGTLTPTAAGRPAAGRAADTGGRGGRLGMRPTHDRTPPSEGPKGGTPTREIISKGTSDPRRQNPRGKKLDGLPLPGKSATPQKQESARVELPDFRTLSAPA